jgi:hypothetical protein
LGAASEDMKTSNKWKIRAFKIRTWLLAVLFLAIGGIFTGIAEIFAVVLLLEWLRRRDIQLQKMQAEEQGIDIDQEIDSLKEHANATLLKYISSFDEGMMGCSICGAEYLPRPASTESMMCSQLRDIHPHKVDDVPEEPNLWAWSWYQFHGYAPPPEDWPLTKPFIAPEVVVDNLIIVMKQKGRRYWMQHRNHLWDMAYAEVPQWYVDRWLEIAA